MLLLIAIGVLTATIIINSPFYLERPWEPLEKGGIYSFQDWEIELDFLDMHFNNGVVVLGYQHDELTGMVIKGDGDYQVNVPSYRIKENNSYHQSGSLEAVYLPITEDTLDKLKGNVIFSPISDHQIDLDYSSYFEAEQKLLAKIETFNISRTIHPGETQNMSYLFTEDYDAKYYESKTINLSSCDGKTTQLVADSDRKPYPPENFQLFTISYLLISLLLLALLVYIFSVDIDEFYYKHSASQSLTTIFTIIFSGATFFFWRWIDLEVTLSDFESGLFYLIASAILLMLHLRQGSKLIELGLTTHNLIRSIVISFSFSLLIMGLSTLMLPSGLSFPDDFELFNMLLIIFFVILFKELVLRSFLLGSLEKILGANLGLFIHILGISVINLILIFITDTHLSFGTQFSTFLDILILPLFTTAFLGYLYQRVRNIFCPVLIQVFVILLSNIIYF